MLQEKTEQLFSILDASSTYIAKQLGKSYLESLIDIGESIFQEESVLDMPEQQLADIHKFINDYYAHTFSREEHRRAFQLALLNGMKGQVISGTGMTPDVVCLFTGYLAKRFKANPQVVFDPAVGSGNLLTCLLNQYEQSPYAWATEVDPLLIRLAYVNANLQKHPVELYHQDALKPLPGSEPSADLLVCDLPVGIYPNLEEAKKFSLYEEKDESDDTNELLTHHLLIEQSIRHCQDGAYMIFIVPNSLFTETGADRLRNLISKETYIQSLMQFPTSLFQQGSIHKSLFVIQKKGRDVRKPKEVLLTTLPSFSKQNELSSTIDQIDQWIQQNK